MGLGKLARRLAQKLCQPFHPQVDEPVQHTQRAKRHEWKPCLPAHLACLLVLTVQSNSQHGADEGAYSGCCAALDFFI